MRTELLFERRTAVLLTLVIGGMGWLMLAVSAGTADGLVFANGGVLGGDHVAFWTAGRAALSDTWSAIYAPEAFEAALARSPVAQEAFGLTWQYPPHAALALAPLGLMPLTTSWAVWTAASFVVFAAAMNRLVDADWRTVGLVLLSPALFQAAVTGQTGAWAGAGLLGALLLPDRRPVTAGICAGLLTLKPQLGLLLPFAYLAGGHYRTAGVAAATAGAMVAASIVWFGADAWTAFAGALLGVTEGVADARYPLGKMVTVFAAMRSASVPEGIAFAVQAAAFLAAAALTVRVWRSAASPMARAALTACLVFLTTPYAYYYDLAILTLPGLYVLRALPDEAPGRRALIYALWGAPLMIVGAGPYGAFVGLAGVLALTVLTLRAAAPQTRLSLSPA